MSRKKKAAPARAGEATPATRARAVPPLFTLGHSTRTLEELLALLREHRVTLVVDVRKISASRAHPRFAGPALAASLAAAGIGYEHLPALGGRRGRQADVSPATNAQWRNRSFHHYADWALGDEFQAGLARLRALGRRRRCAVMCAEAVWWRCHRRIIADHLLAKGETVLHIMSPGRADPAKRTPGSRLRAGRLTYPGPG